MKSVKRKLMRCFTWILVLCLLLPLLGTYASAKTISGGHYDELAVDPTIQGDGFSSVLYDNKSGLPTSEANAIAETEEGFIWIGSYSGLIRYDGNTFVRMDSTNGVSSVVSLFVDSKNRLWIGTNDNGVAVMERGVFTTFDIEDGLRSSSVRSITEDADGNIYVATTHGLNVIGPDLKIKDTDIKQLNDEYICELRISEGGNIYGETLDGDIFTIKGGDITLYPNKTLGDWEVNCVLPDPDNEGCVYIGTTESEIYYGRLGASFEELDKFNVYPLRYLASVEKFRGQLWACGDNGIGVVNETGFHKLDNVPLNNSVEHVFVDYEGNLWFTSSRQGIMKIVPNRFTNLFERYGLESAVVNSTCLYSNMLFIGTDTGLRVVDENGVVENVPMTCLDPKSKFAEYTNLVELLDGLRIRSIIKDEDGRMMFSTYSNRGLVIYDAGTVDFYDMDRGLPSNRVRTVYERKDGILLVACSGGMAMIQNGEVIEVYDGRWGLSNQEVLSITEADNGDIILGSDGNGIYIINGHNVRNLGKKDGLNSEVVMRIKRDEDRNIFWIVTSNSIAYMTEDYEIHTIKNFPYSNNFDMYENSQGDMWILSSNGIYVVPVNELIANGDINPVYLSMDNGLPCVATANSYSDINSNGILYISGTTGVAKVNIEESMMDVSDIKMAVPYIEVDGTYIYPDNKGTFTVPSSVSRITIYGYIYSYVLVNPKVTYWLDGFDNEFITVNRSDLEPIVYTNLEGGNYHFTMILQDSLGKGQKQLDILIVKQKSFVEMAWFKMLLILGSILLFAAAVAFIVRKKTQALSKKNEQNKLFIDEMAQAFAKTIDMKDKYTNGHSQRVAEYTAMLTKELGYDDETVDRYRNIALLHDIGKISIPPEVLNKNGQLSDDEFKIIKSHSAQGYQVLKDISIMPELAIGAGQHHERPDGKGYPKGLKGEEIARVAQIIAVADTFDAMYSDRPYRKRMNFDKAVSIIKEVSGTQLTEDVVDAFLRIVERGGLRAEDDNGGGSLEDIDNIHKKQRSEGKKK